MEINSSKVYKQFLKILSYPIIPCIQVIVHKFSEAEGRLLTFFIFGIVLKQVLIWTFDFPDRLFLINLRIDKKLCLLHFFSTQLDLGLDHRGSHPQNDEPWTHKHKFWGPFDQNHVYVHIRPHLTFVSSLELVNTVSDRFFSLFTTLSRAHLVYKYITTILQFNSYHYKYKFHLTFLCLAFYNSRGIYHDKASYHDFHSFYYLDKRSFS